MTDVLKELDDLYRKSSERTAVLQRLSRDVETAKRELATLTEERNELRGALSYALPALEWLIERSEVDDDHECDADGVCGLRDCENCGCIILKLDLAHRALANAAKGTEI